jgi:hypothetical protein
MTAALGTLPFLATLWLLVVLGAAVLEESGAKIAAALKGEPPRLPSVRGMPSRHLRKRCEIRPGRASGGWRAAA